MSFYSNILGALGNFFQIGGPTGPGINNSSGILQARNAANNAFVRFQVANPVSDMDAVNLLTLQEIGASPVYCTLQYNGNSAIPTNSSTVQWYVTTTSGTNASIGQLVYDDGSSSGNATIYSAQTGAQIFTPNSLTGGTISFSAGQGSYWSGSSWVPVSPNVQGADFNIALTCTTTGTTSSAQVPANAIVDDIQVVVGTGYTSGGTLEIGISGSLALFLGTSAIPITTAGTYVWKDVNTSVGSSAAALIATIGGSPSAGALVAYVRYRNPLT